MYCRTSQSLAFALVMTYRFPLSLSFTSSSTPPPFNFIIFINRMTAVCVALSPLSPFPFTCFKPNLALPALCYWGKKLFTNLLKLHFLPLKALRRHRGGRKLKSGWLLSFIILTVLYYILTRYMTWNFSSFLPTIFFQHFLKSLTPVLRDGFLCSLSYHTSIDWVKILSIMAR